MGYAGQRLLDTAPASIRIELALLEKAFTLSVRPRRLRAKPFIPKPGGDPSRVRQGFLTREEVERLCSSCTCTTDTIEARAWSRKVHKTCPEIIPCWHLPAAIADVVTFLFYSAWRVGEVRTLE